MNKALFEQAQSAYERQDYATALDLFNQVAMDQNFVLGPGEFGLVHHQIGNCFVKLGSYTDAISAYVNSTSDNNYIAQGTVYYNLGMAYALMNDFGNAINNFQIALNNEKYHSKYKAYTAMGNALMKSGKSADAAAAFRSAALDNRNPDPTRALLNLGVCFMALNRSEDAISVYESAFQFSMPDDIKNRLNANLGQAYVASGKMQKAVTAFENALRDKTYVLSDSASVDYQRAIAAVSKGNEQVDMNAAGPAAAAAAGMAVGEAMANPQQAQAAQGQGESFDPYAPQSTPQQVAENTSYSDSLPPQSADEEFQKWTNSAKDAAYNVQKKKHPVKTFFGVLLLVIAGLIIAGSVAFCFGFGFPSQEMVVKQFFANPIESKDKVFDETVSDLTKNSYVSAVPQDSNCQIKGIKRAVNESTVYASATTQAGGEAEYKIRMTRDLVGWKIHSVDLAFASRND